MIEKQKKSQEYRSYKFRKIIFIMILVLALFVVSGVALTIGGRNLAFWDVYKILYEHLEGASYPVGSSGWWDDYTVWNIRLPRILLAIICGGSLAVSGAAMQSVVKNPLADPYTTGIASAAVFGVTVGIVMGFTLSSTVGEYGLIINAFLFGLIPVSIVTIISRFNNSSPATMILAGVAMSFLFSALSTLLLVTSDAATIHTAYMWQIGTLENALWSDLPLITFITIIGTFFLIVSSKKLNLLILGDESAKSLGMDVEKYRIVVLILLSFMTASVVSYVGIIGFVGLVSPHIVRLFLGSDNKYIIPASMVFGSVLLLSADLIARLITTVGVPVSVVMSFIGGPVFLLLIIRSKKDLW